MGTRLRVVAEAARTDDARAATEMVVREMERQDRLLSTWVPSTETSRLNRAPAGEEVSISSELHALLLEARAWARVTGGAFEPAVGALVDAWDLRGEGRAPEAATLVRARAASGSTAWTVDPARAVAVRRDDRAWIDTGGFGKGAALRSAAKLLRADARDSVRLLADLGGQIWAAAPPDRPWTVPVAHPGDREEPVAELLLHDVSVATSGSSERWVEVDGRRYGHILDPRTGQPAPAWGAVTVVHPDAMAADVLATALFVMGPDEGPRWLASHPDVAALFLDAREDRLRLRWTPSMERWLSKSLQDTNP